MNFAKQWIVAFVLSCSFVLFWTGSLAAQEERPTFYPNRTQADQWGSRPVQGQDVPAGREILDTDRDLPYGYAYTPNQYAWPDKQPDISPLLTGGDPVSLIPHAMDLANKYGIVQCVAVLLVIFIFQYVRSAQKSATQREEFFHQQLNYSDKRTTDELTRLSSKLALMEQDIRSLQDRFDRHAELIRTNGQLCREIVSTMTAHNLAVEQGIAELGAKIESLTVAFRRKLRNKNGNEKP